MNLHRFCTGLLLLVVLPATALAQAEDPPIHIAFLWHMHQPIYWPGETVVQTDAAARYAYSVTDIHLQRMGPYTTWPWNAVQKGIAAGMGHFGAQVSFSGSLMDNLDALAASGQSAFFGWTSPWSQGLASSTNLGNPRIDLVAFGFHHPLMALIRTEDVAEQIARHRATLDTRLPGTRSRGIFPPENAFATPMIPALVQEGLEWVLVDNIHFERASTGYPYSTSGNLVEPNPADVRNADPADWVALTGLWAPTPVSGGWGHRPHWVEHVDPATGAVSRIVAVPTERYMGNEDGRGGFGALNYDEVMSQVEAYNDDPDHPLLLVLHHDGDNFGGGSESYYEGNFQAFVDWLAQNPTRFVCTTIQDYLDQYPPDPDDVIHAESGSWAGADNGDPEFKKWLGDVDGAGYSPDQNSWATLTAARNLVQTAAAAAPGDPAAQSARDALLNAQASDYWYWDGAQDGIWDSHPTRAANAAVAAVQPILAGATDTVGPEIFLPQREPYNPGGTEWGLVQPRDFEVWTFVHDAAGLQSVTLYVREDADGTIPPTGADNHTYAGGAGVGAWSAWPMSATVFPASTTNPSPSVRAERYAATLSGFESVLLDYYVEALDGRGNASRSAIQHVYVGDGNPGPGAGVSWTPAEPEAGDTITISLSSDARGAELHWGLDGFQTPPASWWPPNSYLYQGSGPALRTPFVSDGVGGLRVQIGPVPSPVPERLDFVVQYDDGSWDNNGTADYRIFFGGAPTPFTMDGLLDPAAEARHQSGEVPLYTAFDGQRLYLATDPANAVGQDVFLLVARQVGAARPAMWSKSGQVTGWDAYVGNESSNGWSGWFDTTTSVGVFAGGVLEATFDVLGEYGEIPGEVEVAVLRYGTADAGVLLGQFPPGNGDGNLDAVEWQTVPLLSTAAPVRDVRARLHPNRPNPFNPRTEIHFDRAGMGRTRVEIFDLRGRRLRRLLDAKLGEGTHAIVWDGRDDAGHEVVSGTYLVRLRTDDADASRKIVLVR